MTTRALVTVSIVLAACASKAERNAPVRAEAAALSGASVESTAPPPRSRLADIPHDSVRGVIESVGSEPLTHLILRQHDGSTCAVRAAPDVITASVAGLEVTLWGSRGNATPPTLPGVSCAFSATHYAVRAADGVAAVDGILRGDGARFTLELASGERRALRGVPAVLRTRVGARIFWAGPLDRAPATYGVLALAPK